VPEQVLETEEPSEIAPAAEPKTFDRGALEEKTTARLAAAFKDDEDGDIEEPAAETEEVEEKPAAEKKPEEKEETEETEETAAGEQAKPKPTPAASPVPAAFRRSLKAFQWTDEEIDNAYKVDPANFLKTAAKLHETRNESTRQMAEIGRRQKQAAATDPKATQQQPAQPTKFDPIDVEALKKRYGPNEPIIQQLERMNGLVTWANQMMPVIQQSQERQQQSELATLNKSIDSFFTGDDLKPYAEEYGKVGQQLTDKQLESRAKVLEHADLLISGARQMGRNITLEEALTLAHDAVSGPVKTQAARRQLTGQVQQRQAAQTLRPGTRRTAAPANDRKGLEANVKKGLAKAFSA
jgi:hypothetical protein